MTKLEGRITREFWLEVGVVGPIFLGAFQASDVSL